MSRDGCIAHESFPVVLYLYVCEIACSVLYIYTYINSRNQSRVTASIKVPDRAEREDTLNVVVVARIFSRRTRTYMTRFLESQECAALCVLGCERCGKDEFYVYCTFRKTFNLQQCSLTAVVMSSILDITDIKLYCLLSASPCR